MAFVESFVGAVNTRQHDTAFQSNFTDSNIDIESNPGDHLEGGTRDRC